MSQETKDKISAANKGQRHFGYKHTAESLEKISEASKGRAMSESTKSKIRKIALKNNWGNRLPILTGSNHPRWKGGVTSENEKIRKSKEMRNWRISVFERDDYTCQACGQRGGELNADHIMPFALFPELRTEVLNGRTLCIKCHRKTFLTKEDIYQLTAVRPN